MKYPDGREIMKGDKVRLGEETEGVVVCSIDLDDFSDEHPKEAWGYLSKGVMIEFEKYGLIHYADEPSYDLVLISRNTSNW